MYLRSCLYQGWKDHIAEAREQMLHVDLSVNENILAFLVTRQIIQVYDALVITCMIQASES